MEHLLKIENTNNKKQIAYCIVYRPMIIDAHGDAMTAEEVEKMAYNFMKSGQLANVDTNHDNVHNGSYIVESWIVKEGDPIFTKQVDIGAWAVGIKVPNIEIWDKIENGLLNGVSFEAFAKKSLRLVEVLSSQEFYGVTQEYEDHSHWMLLFLDDKGDVIYGQTDSVMRNGALHSHEIFTSSITSESNGHSHRYSLQGETL